MTLFTAGNLITLGIVFLVIILFRQLDQNNRSLDKVRKYGEKLKEDLGTFVSSKEGAVRDYAIELDVQQKAAQALMKRLQSAEEALVLKTENITKIDERISAYDKSLEELLRMTARAQENLDRLREESGFTDGVLKRVKDAKDALESMEKALPEIEASFRRENDAAMEQAVSGILASVQSTVSDLASTAETIERRVEDHREAVQKVEKERRASLEHDVEFFRKAFDQAQDNAQTRADQMEEASFKKLKEQSLERAQRFQTAVDEKLSQFQEASKARLSESQELVKGIKEEWKRDFQELEEKKKAFREEWKRDAQELALVAKTTREEWKQDAASVRADLHAAEETIANQGAAIAEETLRKARSLAESAIAENNALLASLKAELTAQVNALRSSVDETGARFAALEEEARTVETQVLVKASEAADRRQAELSTSLEAAFSALTRRLADEKAKADAASAELNNKAAETASRLDAFTAEVAQRLASSAEEAERQVLANTEGRLEAYRVATSTRFERLEALSNDVGQLDAELRRQMAETEERVRRDFALFEKEADSARSNVGAQFTEQVGGIRAEMGNLEKELNTLKESAYANVSAKLKLFEDDFFADLAKRSEDIDSRLDAWKASLDTTLESLASTASGERAKVEAGYTDGLREGLAQHAAQSAAELQRLKEQTGAFEEGIRDQMAQADQSLDSFKVQMAQDLAEAREAAAAATRSEIGKHSIAMAELVKKEERELEEMLKILAGNVEERRAEMSERIEASRRELEAWQAKVSQQLREAEAAVDESRKRARDLAVENDERLAAVRTAIEDSHEQAVARRAELFGSTEERAQALDAAIKDADRRIKEFVAQTKLFERSDELKAELERRIEDLRADLDGLDQRRKDAAELETQFVKIKRLEDEVNAKMTRFLSEKRRIELLEADFNRLIQTSQSVDEKLAQVTASDDTLQALQAQLRRLEDATADAAEKYQRIEKKNEILDATAEGIDRNFQSLREAEAQAKKFDGELNTIASDISAMRETIERLAVSKDRAETTMDRLSTLDKDLSGIEKRIEEMQTAREWLARTETRLQEVSKQAQDQVKIMGSLLKAEGGKGAAKGAPPVGVRESVVKLAHQGWGVDEIARAVKISRGEVELILEIAPKG